MDEDKPLTPEQKKFVNYYLTTITVVGAIIGVYLCLNPEVIHSSKKIDNQHSFEYIRFISDLNKDGFPELEVKNKNNSIDTLVSTIKNKELLYK
ncbi:hypothetical protein COV13_00490 [Candidatus Woesearchaeota archaeon CG10_big_fil_rev_8_21_14_0_10_32_9]|nr:MAG: hypothetical protein COV13_00490 [Candidatus Woesearchaeota archaeon CG10_big_fil_rev_8_21_14_0_10_32_9]